jgi:hypothetical protein
MNPHASTNCAGRLFMALAAITSISFLAACGNSPINQNNQVGFNTGSLNGTYVISMAGTDVNSDSDVVPFAIVGTITADGKGGITGTIDINDPGNLGVNLGVAVTSPSGYQIGSDGRGDGTLVTSVANFDIDFVLSSTNQGLITRFDDQNDNIGTGSGTMDMQTSTTQGSLAALSFSLAGYDTSGALGTVGGFTLNTTSGAIVSGTQDFNDDGTSGPGYVDLLLGGQLVLAGTGTTGTATLATSNTIVSPSGSLNFDVWVIDSSHLKFISNDTTDSGVLLSGDAFTQVNSVAPSQEVFTLAGLDSGGAPVFAGGYVSITDANCNLSNGLEDFNDDGTVGLGKPFSGTGSYNTSTGRCENLLNGFSNGLSQNFLFATYSSSGGALSLEIDSLGLLQGVAYTQSATSFTAPGNYALNLSGSNGNGEVDDIAQFNATTTAAPAANMNGVLDENNLGNLNSGPLSGAYTPDPTPDGRGSMLISTPNTALTGLTLQYYAVDSATAVFIEVDSGQGGVGVFEGQTAPGGDAAVAKPHVAVVHPAVRPHAVKTKWTPAASRK